MKKNTEQLSELKLVGITARTSNAAEFKPETAKIEATIKKFFKAGLPDKIFNRKNPGTLFSVYTNYESDVNGEYTYFIGEEVTAFDNIPAECEKIVIPAQKYAKFTSAPGEMPAVVINMWQNIWKMNEADLGGKRAYIADFERYDERSADPKNAIVDVYIGVK